MDSARAVLLRLAGRAGTGEVVRRRVALAELEGLPGRAGDVVAALAGARLLTVRRRPGRGGPRVAVPRVAAPGRVAGRRRQHAHRPAPAGCRRRPVGGPGTRPGTAVARSRAPVRPGRGGLLPRGDHGRPSGTSSRRGRRCWTANDARPSSARPSGTGRTGPSGRCWASAPALLVLAVVAGAPRRRLATTGRPGPRPTARGRGRGRCPPTGRRLPQRGTAGPRAAPGRGSGAHRAGPRDPWCAAEPARADSGPPAPATSRDAVPQG